MEEERGELRRPFLCGDFQSHCFRAALPLDSRRRQHGQASAEEAPVAIVDIVVLFPDGVLSLTPNFPVGASCGR